MPRKSAAILLVAALSSTTPAAAVEVSNPDLFRKSLEAAEQALRFYGNYDNRDEMRRVADIGYRLAQESGFEKFPFAFYLADMPVPNAFALPGGQIFVTKGMLDLQLNDDMLAGLMGHEIGHVVRQHGIRMQRRATLLNALSQALLVGVMITASGGSSPSPVPGPSYDRGSSPGDRVVGVAAAGLVVSELLLRSYSREFEDEADIEGQRMAAAAGFDPDGTRQLMALMRERLPETKQYGYWRTHPFFDQRVRAAAIREEMLKIQEATAADVYRQETQRVLLAFGEQHQPARAARERVEKEQPPRPDARRAEEQKPKEPLDLLKMAALTAWPVGETAERLRLERLHRARDREMERRDLYRDLGSLIALYREEDRELSELDPDSKLLQEIEREIDAYERQIDATYPRAAEVFREGVYETEFLQTFLSNYDGRPEIGEVRLALGNACSRLGRPAEAVGHYLAAWRGGPDTEAGTRARAGLRNLAPVLESLAALQQLSEITEDPELSQLASARLDAMVPKFAKLDNGSDFLRNYPNSPHAEAVNGRLNDLAENLYGEVVLYQAVGDHAKALERIQTILTSAPLSPAAERLRDQAVVES